MQELARLLAEADQPLHGRGSHQSDRLTTPPTLEPPTDPMSVQGRMSALRSFRRADQRVGGANLYASVVDYLHRQIAPGLFRASTNDHEAFAAAAALTEMAGWMAHDAGCNRVASEHFSRAVDLAQVGGDRRLIAHIHASRSHLAYHLTSFDRGVDLARRARAQLSSGSPQPEIVARTLALEARGHAALGNGRECVRLLSQAESVLTTAGVDRSPWASPFDEASLATETARALYALGDLDAAGRCAKRVLALRPRERARSHAFGQLMLIAVLIAQNRMDETCAAVQDALDVVAHVGSVPVVRRLIDVRQRLSSHRRSAMVATTLDQLDDVLREHSSFHRAVRGTTRPVERL